MSTMSDGKQHEAAEAPAEAASPYHAGELAVQQRAGVLEKARRLGMMFRDHMPDQHRAFYATLPFMLVGSVDEQGRLWASVVTGRPGFAHSPDPRTLRLDTVPMPGDPLAGNVRLGASLGLLGIQLHTRRRNRMNGKVVATDERGFTVAVDQSFGNCEHYIQARTSEFRAQRGGGAAAPVEPEGARLSPDALGVIARADTLFIATASSGIGAASPAEGVDINHRGMPPGTIRIAADAAGRTTVSIPDLPGNNAFQTFGNLRTNPRAGLLVPDFERGDLISLTGEAEVLWDDAAAAEFPGATRVLRFHVNHGLRFKAALPFRWSAPELAPQFRFER
jgi:predicted pyridoxine 5'-phosphate oxidase superfamily flavin-nucleotide-binding protein